MIDLSITSDEKDLVDSIRDVAANELPFGEGVQAAVSGGKPFDEKRWQRVANLGWLGISVPEDEGGIGLGLPQELLVMIELGRVAASGPFVGTMLAARLMPNNETIIDGRRRAGILVGDLAVDAGVGDLAVQVDADGARVVGIEEAEAVTPVDESIPVNRVTGLKVVAQEADPSFEARLRVLVGGYLVGLAVAAAAMSAEYAKTREQFGRPIGAFQAVKHRCAEQIMRAYPPRAQLAAAGERHSHVRDGFDVPTGETGELWVRGPNIVPGYWRHPEDTERAFTDGWHHSGDVARVDEEGRVYLVDRLKDIVIRAGENVYRGEVEAALYDHPAVHTVAVIGLPEPRLGEEVTAVVRVRPGFSVSVAELQDLVGERLARFKVPSRGTRGEAPGRRPRRLPGPAPAPGPGRALPGGRGARLGGGRAQGPAGAGRRRRRRGRARAGRAGGRPAG